MFLKGVICWILSGEESVQNKSCRYLFDACILPYTIFA